MQKQTYCFVTNLAINIEPTVANRLQPYISKLMSNNHKVILVSADRKGSELFDSDNFKHVSIYNKKKRPTSFLKRALFEWVEARDIWKKVKKLEADKTIVTIPSMFLLFNLYIVRDKNIVLDVRDLTWEYLSTTKPLHLVAKLVFRLLANISFKFCNAVVVTNNTEARYFKNKNIEALCFSNGVTNKQFLEISQIKKKQTDVFTITYVGKVGVAQKLKTLIDSASMNPDVKFNIVGDGPEYSDLLSYKNKLGVNNVEFYGNVDWQSVLNLYSQSDVLYAQLNRDFRGAMPSKLYQYLCAKRIVIYAGMGQAVETLNEFERVITIPPEDVNELSNAIVSAKNIKSEPIKFRNNIKKIESLYIREKNVEAILAEW